MTFKDLWNPITYITATIIGLLITAGRALVISGKKYQGIEDRLTNLENTNKKNETMNNQILERLDTQDKTLAELQTQIAVLTTTVIGIDGTNGIRGDLREMRDDLKDYFKKSA